VLKYVYISIVPRTFLLLMEFLLGVMLTASQRIKQLQKSRESADSVLRLAVNSGGCSGYSYSFTMEEPNIGEQDRWVPCHCNGVNVSVKR
jgi:Fe-S cluster assembly iron-binding protein IscA